MEAYYPYIKALHLIFVVTWFAGLFYMPRLFIYHIESRDKGKSEAAVLGTQFRLMERRLWYIITWPSAILCTLFAFTLLAIMPGWLQQGWMHVKLGFVVVLWGYHLLMHRMFLKFQREAFSYTSGFMRIWNEGATLILFAMVFLAVVRHSLNWIYGLLGLIGLAVLLMLGIRLYKKLRKD
ncbi:putative membrane protein [Robiginitalea myxolifaciens]|uniref:Protoporphyrinogen IX oxidase n=1 Tax=Robiginitalea myxolifaciens TaxID=400055 RepID=A0A1I6FZX4_9FLAO|nr:CopD family protein [Robiginitalea myxolifaciens]SFR35472.1 putative membrane protein [Robiginitalea myxolifaciens]